MKLHQKWESLLFHILQDLKANDIFYNDAMDYCRVNNTIMHEIGHIVLNHSEDSELAEKEVKFFAKFALAPPVLVHEFQLTSAKEIADVFGISFEAAKYAYYYNKWFLFGGRLHRLRK